MRIIIDINELDEQILLNQISDIEAWITGAVDGKIAQCRKRILISEQARGFAGGMSEDETLGAIFSDPDYLDRSDRDLLSEVD